MALSLWPLMHQQLALLTFEQVQKVCDLKSVQVQRLS